MSPRDYPLPGALLAGGGPLVFGLVVVALAEVLVGGMAASLFGMGVAAAGYLPPVAGAVAQEVIDVAAAVNALRVAFPPRKLADY